MKPHIVLHAVTRETQGAAALWWWADVSAARGLRPYWFTMPRETPYLVARDVRTVEMGQAARNTYLTTHNRR